MSKRVSSVKNFPSIYPDAEFTEAGIRWLIFNKEKNGFHKCVIKVGKKVLIDLDRFEKWLDDGGDKNESA
jgi:hypothetical protein